MGGDQIAQAVLQGEENANGCVLAALPGQEFADEVRDGGARPAGRDSRFGTLYYGKSENVEDGVLIAGGGILRRIDGRVVG